MSTSNTYFCSCMGSACRCADNLDRDILAILADVGAMSAFNLAESTGVSVAMVRESLTDLIAQKRVTRTAREYALA